MRERPLDHIGVAVASIEAVRSLYERMTDSKGTEIVELPETGVRVAFFGAVELLEPLGEESPIARFLAKRGDGIHHLAYRVPKLAEELARLESEGYELVDRVPRPGARGEPVAFVHPKSTGGVLFELVEGNPEPRAGY